MPIRLAPALLLAALLPCAAPAQSRADPEAATAGSLAPKPEIRAERHMIVAANPHAAEAGRDMLRRGGSAADAAIAALLVLGVVEPQSSGLGGGAFALVHGPDGLAAWDARETAPAAATPGLFLEDGQPLPWIVASESGRAVGVPALGRLLEALHARHGRLGWEVLAAPAIRLAEAGFAVSPRLAGLTERFAERLARTEAGWIFLPGGRPLEAGETLRRPALARTLRRIAEAGPGVLYEGEIAAAIAAAAARPPRPGALSPADIAAYRAVERAPLCLAYRGAWRVCGMGPPSSGATTVGQILGLLGAFDIAGLGAEHPRLWHLFAEASRLAYADRAAYLGDPDRVDVPADGLLDPGYLADRARLIDPAAASRGPAAPGTPPGAPARGAGGGGESPGTTHLSVIDADGLAISLTASIETAFGSGRLAAGLLLNNQLTDFAFTPADAAGRPRANAPDGGKRPRSSMAPTVVYRAGGSEPVLLLGSPGGSRIPEYVAGALLRLLDFGQGPAEAAAGFHLSHRNRGETVLETAAPEALARGLAARGHAVSRAEMTSGLHILRISPEGLSGGADPRREGTALGD